MGFRTLNMAWYDKRLDSCPECKSKQTIMIFNVPINSKIKDYKPPITKCKICGFKRHKFELLNRIKRREDKIDKILKI